MNKTNKLLSSAIFAVLLASSASSVQADGFFKKLFSSSASGGADFKTLLSHVPADTAYLIANKKPYPEEIVQFHLNRSKDILKMFSDLEKSEDSKDTSDADKSTPGAFFSALFNDIAEKIGDKKTDETGLSLKATSMIYGFNTMPVMRITFADKDKLMASIKRAEKKSDYQVKLEKCGDYDCFVDDEKDQSIALVFLKDHLAASLFPATEKQNVIDHLTGKTQPKASYSTDNWDAFLKENDYKGYGDGFINLKKLAAVLKPKALKSMDGKVDPKELEGCAAVVDDHLDNVPEIDFGTKNLELKEMNYEMVVKTSPDVSSVLQGIANETNIAKRIENPVFDLGVNINFARLRDALTQYSNFLIKSGETHHCKSIKAKDIRKGMGGMMMAMNMGLTQFKSLYASLSDIQFDEKMSPKKVDAYISIGTDDPAGLIGMVGMFSPKLMGFKVPADGSAVKLPKDAIPSKGQPVPDIFLSRTAKSLNIMVGNDKPALKDNKSSKPEIISVAVDGKRYYKILSKLMKVLPKPPQDEHAKDVDVAKMMEDMSDVMGNIEETFSADKRGLVVDYRITY